MNEEQLLNDGNDAESTGRENDAVAKWWLAVDDTPEGPHTSAYIAMLLSKGSIKPATLVCRVGKADWQPIFECTELAKAVEGQSPGVLPPALPISPGISQKNGGFLGRFTNPALPRFANWICIYCILIVPAFYALGYLFTLGGFHSAAELKPDSPLAGYAVAYDVIVFVADVALVVVLVLGGLLLRKLQHRGVVLIKVGLTLHLCWMVIVLLLFVFWSAIVTAADEFEPIMEGWTAANTIALLVGVPVLLLWIAMIVFEVVALIWLFRNEARLPLQESETASLPMEAS